MTPHDPASWDSPQRGHYQAPPTAQQTAGDTRAAIFAYRAHRFDPLYQPPPNAAQVRLIACFLYEYIHAPMFTYPRDELRRLRGSVEHIVTERQLDDWLWDCRAIGIEPL